MSLNTMDRIVVTGVGAVTPVELTTRETWESLLAGSSGVAEIASFDATAPPVRTAMAICFGFRGQNAVTIFRRSE